MTAWSLSTYLLNKLDLAIYLFHISTGQMPEVRASVRECFDGFVQTSFQLYQQEQAMLNRLHQQGYLTSSHCEELAQETSQMTAQIRWIEQLRNKQVNTREDETNLATMLHQHRESLVQRLIPVLEQRLSCEHQTQLALLLASDY